MDPFNPFTQYGMYNWEVGADDEDPFFGSATPLDQDNTQWQGFDMNPVQGHGDIHYAVPTTQELVCPSLFIPQRIRHTVTNVLLVFRSTQGQVPTLSLIPPTSMAMV